MITNEGNSFSVTFSVYNESGSSYTPSTARYKVECLTNRRSIRSYTTLTAATSMQISITPDDNVILNDLNRTERRQITVQTDHGTDSQKVFVAEWDVRALQ